MEKSDLLVMNEMADKDLDIKMSPHFVSAKTAKGGGHVTMGVPKKIIQDLVLNDGKYYVGLYIVNKEQFDQIKNRD